MIKNFQDFILESKSYKSKSVYPDDYCRLDKTFTDFDLRDISPELLKKQFKNFKIYLTPQPIDSPLLEWSKQDRVLNGVTYSFDVEDVKTALFQKYSFMDWQFETRVMDNDIKVACVIPNVDDNIEMIIDDMTSMGYYVSFINDMSYEGFPYVLIRFEPRFPDDVTNIVRKMGVIYHLSPKYNLESIKENGFIPLSKNTQYYYPPRIHLIKSKTDDADIESLGRKLYHFDNNPIKNGEYVLFSISTSKIPKNVRFIGDCNYQQGICTEDKIPYDCVISIREFKF